MSASPRRPKATRGTSSGMGEFAILCACAFAIFGAVFVFAVSRTGAREQAEARLRQQLHERRGVNRRTETPTTSSPSASAHPSPRTSSQKSPPAATRPVYTVSAEDGITLTETLRRAEMAIDAGDLDAASRWYRGALLHKFDTHSPITRAEVFYRLGVLAEEQRDANKAAVMFERALGADPNLAQARESLDRIRKR